jgi:hypothetical protein
MREKERSFGRSISSWKTIEEMQVIWWSASYAVTAA